MTSFSVSYLLKSLFPNTVTLGVKTSTCKCAVNTIGFIAGMFHTRSCLDSSSSPYAVRHPNPCVASPKFLFSPFLPYVSPFLLPVQAPLRLTWITSIGFLLLFLPTASPLRSCQVGIQNRSDRVSKNCSMKGP